MGVMVFEPSTECAHRAFFADVGARGGGSGYCHLVHAGQGRGDRMLLRSDAQIVLHRIVMLCMEASDHYSSSATRCHNTGLDKMFNSQAISHSQMATELTEHIRCMGDFAGSADPEREAIGELIRQLRELSPCNLCITMLEVYLRMEARLLDAVHGALTKCSERQRKDPCTN